MDEKAYFFELLSSIPGQTTWMLSGRTAKSRIWMGSHLAVVERKEQRQNSDHEFELLFLMCPDEHEYDLLVPVYE